MESKQVQESEQASGSTVRPIGEILKSLSLPSPLDAENERRHQRQMEVERKRRIIAFRNQVGQRYAGCTFDSWKASTEYQASIKTVVQEWAETFTERWRAAEGLVLYGPVGTGKDHLVYAAVDLLVQTRDITPMWINGREFFGEVRDRISTDDPEANLIAKLRWPHLLVISDPLPPIGDLSPHQADMLYRVVEARYSAGKITVVTLNVADDAEADRRLGVATWDRLCDGSWKLHCRWSSHRKPSRELKPA